MKKYLIYLFAASSLLCFGDTYDFRVYRYAGTGILDEDSNMTAYYSYNNIDPSSVVSVLMSSSVGVCCNPQRLANDDKTPLYKPTVPSTPATTQNYARPLVIHTPTGDVQYVSLIYHSSAARAYYNFVARLFQSGYTPVITNNQHFVLSGSPNLNSAYRYGNFSFSTFLLDIESTTNNLYRSMLTDYLNSISQSLTGIHTGIQSINVDLGQFQSDYTSVNQLALNPSSFSYSDMPTMNGLSSFSYEASSVLSDPYISPAFKSQFAANFGRVYGDYLSKAAQVYALDQGDPNSPSYGKSFSDFLADSAGVSKSMQYQYSTPLTNGMQRMTTDWKNAVTNDLAQNTASITNQLAQWKRDLHDDVGAVGSDLNSVIISGNERPDGKSALRVDANVNIGELNISGDIHIDPTQVETLTEGFGDEVSAAVHDWILEWRDWAYDNPDSWSEFYRRFYSEYGPDVITNQLLQISLLTGITNELHTAAWTNELVGIISNGVAGLNLSITNELWDYYFDRFKKSNEFKDDSGAPFSLDLFRQQVFGGGFDESKYRQLDWFSRVELLLYQIGYASTNDAPEVADLEGEFDDMEEELSTANSDFVAASVKVVSVFALVRRFADSVALAFQSSAAPSTGGIVLLNGGSWLVNEPLVLKVPIQVQNAMRLVFQCIWYLSAFVIAWRILMIAWGRIVAIVRWLWSVFDV